MLSAAVFPSNCTDRSNDRSIARQTRKKNWSGTKASARTVTMTVKGPNDAQLHGHCGYRIRKQLFPPLSAIESDAESERNGKPFDICETEAANKIKQFDFRPPS